jgi:hypothetical protein
MAKTECFSSGEGATWSFSLERFSDESIQFYFVDKPFLKMFVFKKQEESKADVKLAVEYRSVATTAALVFTFFAAIRLAWVEDGGNVLWAPEPLPHPFSFRGMHRMLFLQRLFSNRPIVLSRMRGF